MVEILCLYMKMKKMRPVGSITGMGEGGNKGE
jgi:hypothetical protein